MGHGVTNFTSGLEYINESGAINESFSDMLGVAVEYFCDRENFEWAVGEDVIAPTNKENEGGLRLLDNPKKRGQPDTYQGEYWHYGAEDQGGVHINSGVGNKAFYLIANGGPHNGVEVPGIGMEKAIQIAYRANQVYMNTRSQYIDCARGFILAAKDLYGDGDARNVYLAWKAVNLEVKGIVKGEENPSTPQPRKREKKQEDPEPERRKPPAEKPPATEGGFLGDML
jgi:thermolysin